MAARYLQVNNMREKEREKQMRHRSEVIKKETDEINAKTLAQHRAAK